MSDFVILPLIEEVLNDPAASTWLKSSLIAALQRDAVDAANDAALLAALLDRRADVLLTCCRQAAAVAAQPVVQDDCRRISDGEHRFMH